MNFSFTKKSNFSFKAFSANATLAGLRKASSYIMWTLFVVVILGLGYIWYSATYAYSWTEEQKNEYRTTYAGDTSFREERFNQAVALLKERIRLHQNFPSVIKDIFTDTRF